MSPKASYSLPNTLQELPPTLAHFCLHVERTLRTELDCDISNKKLLIALSGGLDSTALLLIFHYLSPRLNCTLLAAHLHHGLRQQADADADAAQELCHTLNIPFFLQKTDVAKLSKESDAGLEQAGREARYTFFAKLRKEHHVHHLLTGHHLNDLAEDVLMRLIRGTGWPGLGGMQATDEHRGLIRPLLLTPRSMLEKFLTTLRVPWQEDLSNQDSSFTRNRVRMHILPLFLEENPNFLESVADLWRLARLDEAYWTQQFPTDQLPEATQTELSLSNTTLNLAHPALRLRIFKHALEQLGPGQPLFTGLDKLDKAWQNKNTGKKFQFPSEKTATIVKHGIIFQAPENITK